MVNLRQAISGFSIIVSLLLPPASHVQEVDPPTKSVAIVGAGSAGLAILKSLLDLPEDTRKGWDIVLYEQRRDVGGIWLPDPNPAQPPELPETPLYPLLHTNTPVPTMTYPGFPFPPNTPLFPSHEHVEQYHRDYANHFSLVPYIRLNHTVLSSSWIGNSTDGVWKVVVQDHNRNKILKEHDHLIVANEHNHIPRIPKFTGQDKWLRSSPRNGPKREILHSIWYRGPERFRDRSVVVVGSGNSAQDVTSQVCLTARRTYHSIRNHSAPPVVTDVIVKPEISHFTSTSIVFVDGSIVSDADFIILGTGYELRIPFLEEGYELAVKPEAHTNETYREGLVTNLRYLFPLHQHIFSLSPSYPTNALAFIGLLRNTSHCPSNIAQSVYVAHAIANASLLPDREDLLQQLAASEKRLYSLGYDPYYLGHSLLKWFQFDYQDNLKTYLQKHGALPEDGKKFVEGWRREAPDFQYLKRGWKRVEDLGTQPEWLGGIITEEDWAGLLRRLNDWQGRWEKEHGLVYPAGLISY
ncbi:hypothetical protein SERLA73DRAFT_77045 [Serpula lacrymans var. lacrymans S7.3]|uniref:FAD/NAD(P)-binding domain-containing protein n=2 Tax=Serpula lacrymans var. lacrymans TaxID=341189 RepID=F8Q8X4_SERL3|nr:uncharacterized protein SERLADRAFT_452617 [Serpula lacrymans var. lacrymans S7.9]EGN95029.1 hypothetical protein SERLA73DRAFT_77045 [Serpula lacrymans var. lacrymans S7.3]EGO20523.1 hypothetical protein SERLADRAFT_452617 [Serpula lacrymans var. lacrymans S7.9]